MLYAKALSAAGDQEQAQAVLTRQSRSRRPDDVDVWYELAEIAGLAGDIVAVHLARAEYFALHGGYQRAIQHLEYARRLVDRQDDEQLARLDQRIIDLRTRLRELRVSASARFEIEHPVQRQHRPGTDFRVDE